MYLDTNKKKDIFKKYGQSETDTGTSEGQIAIFTERINHLTEYLKSNNYFAIINLLLIFTFVLRSFVDANMRDHMFLQFMILLGICISCMFYERKE